MVREAVDFGDSVMSEASDMHRPPQVNTADRGKSPESAEGRKEREAPESPQPRGSRDSSESREAGRAATSLIDAIMDGFSIQQIARRVAGGSIAGLMEAFNRDGGVERARSTVRGCEEIIRLGIENLKIQALETLESLVSGGYMSAAFDTGRYRAMEMTRRSCVSILRLNLFPTRWDSYIDERGPRSTSDSRKSHQSTRGDFNDGDEQLDEDAADAPICPDNRDLHSIFMNLRDEANDASRSNPPQSHGALDAKSLATRSPGGTGGTVAPDRPNANPSDSAIDTDGHINRRAGSEAAVSVGARGARPKSKGRGVKKDSPDATPTSPTRQTQSARPPKIALAGPGFLDSLSSGPASFDLDCGFNARPPPVGASRSTPGPFARGVGH